MTMAHPAPEDLMAWLDGEGEPARGRACQDHVGVCERCRRMVDDWTDLRTRARRWRVDDAPRGLQAVVLAAARDHRRGRRAGSRPAAAGRARIGWSRYRWRIAAAAAVLLAVFEGSQISLCGQVVCRLPWTSTRTAVNELTALPTASSPLPLSQTASFDAQWSAQPRVQFGLPPGAPVVVLWFLDYECPACAAADAPYSAALGQFASAHPGVVSVIVRDWPWNAECNPTLPGTLPGHEGSCAAAVAMRLARREGDAEALKRWLFASQPTSVDDVRRAAATIGGVPDFDARYAAEAASIRREIEGLVPRGAVPHMTPAIYVNGALAATPDARLLPPNLLARALEIEAAAKRR